MVRAFRPKVLRFKSTATLFQRYVKSIFRLIQKDILDRLPSCAGGKTKASINAVQYVQFCFYVFSCRSELQTVVSTVNLQLLASRRLFIRIHAILRPDSVVSIGRNTQRRVEISKKYGRSGFKKIMSYISVAFSKVNPELCSKHVWKFVGTTLIDSADCLHGQNIFVPRFGCRGVLSGSLNLNFLSVKGSIQQCLCKGVRVLFFCKHQKQTKSRILRISENTDLPRSTYKSCFKMSSQGSA